MKMKVFEPTGAPHDDATIEQLETCARAGNAPVAAICADGHLGYSAPIGSAVGYEDYVSPSGVGFDIGCGNKAVETDLVYADVAGDLARIMDEIARRISFGVGLKNEERVDHPVLERIGESSVREVAALRRLASEQLGTVGSGNHYVDLFEDRETGRVWVGVHFGSRGFGHKVATGFLALAQGIPFDGKYREGGMMDEPTLLPIGSPLGDSYLEAMALAGEYAYAGRDAVVDKVLEILGNPGITQQVHNHHNYQWREEHDGLDLWVVRKGSTPLFPGQLGFVGATMGEDAVILEGAATETARDALHSAPHGAGRALSRTKAAGKWKKRWVNNVRDDEALYESEAAALAHPGAKTARKTRIRVGGLVDYDAVKREMAEKGIEVRGGGADEAPMAYKRLPEVLAAHGDALTVKHRLRPIGVCMADEKTFDPYKD